MVAVIIDELLHLSGKSLGRGIACQASVTRLSFRFHSVLHYSLYTSASDVLTIAALSLSAKQICPAQHRALMRVDVYRASVKTPSDVLLDHGTTTFELRHIPKLLVQILQLVGRKRCLHDELSTA